MSYVHNISQSCALHEAQRTYDMSRKELELLKYLRHVTQWCEPTAQHMGMAQSRNVHPRKS